MAGTSAGAISASLLAAGYNAAGREIIVGLDYNQFKDGAGRTKCRWSSARSASSSTSASTRASASRSGSANNSRRRAFRTFADLVHPDFTDDPRYRSKLQVVVSDVTTPSSSCSHDAGKLGIEPDRLDVALAVQMSMSIPIFFEPVRWENPKTGQTQ